MKKRVMILIMTVILAVFTVSAGAFAQDINIEDMDNAQLMSLLVSIMQKLQEEETEPAAEPAPAEPAEPDPAPLPSEPEPDTEPIPSEPEPDPVPAAVPEPEPEIPAFTVYENKTLLKEALPESYFYVEEKEEKQDKPGKKKPGNPCSPGCSWGCGDWGCGCVCG